jgi:hypothetical protein
MENLIKYYLSSPCLSPQFEIFVAGGATQPIAWKRFAPETVPTTWNQPTPIHRIPRPGSIDQTRDKFICITGTLMLVFLPLSKLSASRAF